MLHREIPTMVRLKPLGPRPHQAAPRHQSRQIPNCQALVEPALHQTPHQRARHTLP